MIGKNPHKHHRIAKEHKANGRENPSFDIHANPLKIGLHKIWAALESKSLNI